ncbi:MAG: cupin domain-containing protein [Synergistaceae bacterium]|nr:cupin domain-containing protein [Synergistaceae bacterium]
MTDLRGNVFWKEGIPEPEDAERVETLWTGRGARVERIVSTGQCSPEGFWYDQEEDEWVVLLEGFAALEYEDGERVELRRGDWLLIPAHHRHRVAFTSSDPCCVWLAFFSETRMKYAFDNTQVMNEMNEMNETNDADMMKQVRDVLDSERLLTARMVDSVLRAAQMASLATPEMQDMFGQWLNVIGNQVLYEVEEKGECDIPALAGRIGVEETTLFSVLAFLHRSGRIRIEKLSFSPGKGKNTEACECLTQGRVSTDSV